MWSDALKKATRDVICEFRLVPDGDVVYFKNFDGRFGLITVPDILAHNLLLSDRKTSVEKLYGSVDELLDDGWVVD